MHSLWVSLKENGICKSCRVSDMVVRPERNRRQQEEESMKKMIPQLILKPNYMNTWFYELNIGDQSRNVVEIIFLAALVKPSKQPRRIRHVFKVFNQIEVLQRFEEYREMVKMNAYKSKRHPRNSVDGNELLRFYGTTITCATNTNSLSSQSQCCHDPACGVCTLIKSNFHSQSQCCHDPACGVCTLIKSNFHTQHTKNIIHLTTSSDTISDNSVAVSKGRKGMKRANRAAILCRTIAGDHMVGHESTTSESEGLVVRDPSAVLPCFVIVFT